MRNAPRNNDESTIQRDWHDLKPGDVIWFAKGWFEVFDAYASNYDTVTVKLTVDGHIETYRVRTSGGKATCRA
ncbi:MAG: hypothetical protein GC159_11475 [Phycisphaera sp.]|nr:hypothetical protein [Phycisphaera sp.]